VKTWAVLPCYNEAERVGPVIDACREQGLEVVVVDDGSEDGTTPVALEHGAEVLRFGTNCGKGAAISTALVEAERRSLDAIITLDGDGQHDPAEISKFLECAERTDADIVVGTRMHDVRTMPFVRKCTNRFMSWVVSRLAGTRISDTQCGYRLMRTRVWSKLRLSTARYDTESEILIQAARRGFSVAEVPVRTIYTGSPSHINPVVDTWRFMRLIFRSFLPRHRRP